MIDAVGTLDYICISWLVTRLSDISKNELLIDQIQMHFEFDFGPFGPMLAALRCNKLPLVLWVVYVVDRMLLQINRSVDKG